MDDSRLADECTVLRANLRHAVFNKETLTIGGGEFNAKLVSDILEMYIRVSMKQGYDNSITIMLDTEAERKTFASIIQGLIMKGLLFECHVLGTKAIIKLSGGS